MNDGEESMHEREDDRLDALLSAVRAEPDSHLWTRVRARLAAEREEPGWVAWLARPVTLAASAAMLLIALTGSLVLQSGGGSGSTASLTDQLLAERGVASAAELDGTSPGADAVSDSGGLQ
jgi:hypothetical protein